MTFPEIMALLRAQGRPEAVAGMTRFGLPAHNALGVSMPALRRLARAIGKNHALAAELWASGVHEARILASLVDDPQCVSAAQLDHWVRDFDAWDVCDQCCLNLFDRTPWAYAKALEWSAREEEFVKRAGFALMAVLAVHDKKAGDEAFLPFLACIQREADDGRNFVKKAVNWALRQIGKRNRTLHAAAIATAETIVRGDARSARWIARDALRELTGPTVISRLLIGR